MKKSLLFISVFCILSITSSVMSQSLQLSDKSGSVANGKIYYVTDTLNYMTYEGIHIKNISTGSVSIKAKKIETSLVSGASCSMCFGVSCYGATTYITPTPVVLAANASDSSFSGHYDPFDTESAGHLGESIITFVFFNVANTTDSAWIVVHFNATLAGINEANLAKAEISNPYPNPAVNITSVNYTLPQNTLNAKVVLNNLLGSKIMEVPVSDQTGTLKFNTEEMKSGIYFYNFYVNDVLVSTKKLIVKH